VPTKTTKNYIYIKMINWYITLINIWIAKFIHLVIKILNLGAGYTWPGHFLLKVNPNFISHYKKKFKKGIIVISGTNGKTTTSKIVTHLLSRAGFSVLNNTTGANLLNGIASALVLDTGIFGGFSKDYGVFEVDEFMLPALLEQLNPDVLILLNLSRDQLDRYGEVDIILERWGKALEKVDNSCKIILDKTQKNLNSLKSFLTVSTKDFLSFDADPKLCSKSSLRGNFNAKNVNAAAICVELFGVSHADVELHLSTFKAAYGRGEFVRYEDVAFHLYLSKNPASLTNNLSAISSKVLDAAGLLFVLNDNIPDGRDVSWIYDVPPENIFDACKGKKIFVSGTRCLDMAVRLKYAGVQDCVVESSLETLVKNIVSDEKLTSVLALPNYSAMLELRKKLFGRSIL
jgi:UDP-N-acetylmuramyl tripeptide synthase